MVAKELMGLLEQYAEWDAEERALFRDMLDEGMLPMDAAREVGRIDN